MYADRLDTSGLPAAAADAADDSVVAAHLVAERTGATGLTDAADSAFVHGMSTALLVTGVTALVAALLVAALLPTGKAGAEAGAEEAGAAGAETTSGDVRGGGGVGAAADARQ